MAGRLKESFDLDPEWLRGGSRNDLFLVVPHSNGLAFSPSPFRRAIGPGSCHEPTFALRKRQRFSSASPARKPCSEPRCLGRASAINGRQGQKLTLWERPVVQSGRSYANSIP